MTVSEYNRVGDFLTRVFARGLTDLCMVRNGCNKTSCFHTSSIDCAKRNLEYLQTGVHKAKTQAASDIDGLMSAMGA